MTLTLHIPEVVARKVDGYSKLAHSHKQGQGWTRRRPTRYKSDHK